MKKRGQLTIFIILGIVILVILAVVYFVLYSPGGIQIIPGQFSGLQKYVDSCVEQTLRDGVTKLGRGFNPDYESALSAYIKEYLVFCPNFTAEFPDLDIMPMDVVSVAASFNSDKSLLNAIVIYPITVKKGDHTETLERFYADYSLVKTGCAAVPVDPSCIYTGSTPITVTVSGLTFTFDPGDFVGIANSCIACK